MAVAHGGNIFAVAEREGVPWQQVLDFSASINPLGPSPAAREAILAALDRIIHYPERSGERLRNRLATAWGVSPDRILVGNGATELLFDWCRHFPAGAIAAPAFGEFHRAWPNAKLCQLASHSSWPSEGAVVLTRPANPTGLLLDADTILAYASNRKDAVLVDESFLDFSGVPSLAPAARGNLFILRSLTKFWALPGLRVGALAGDVAPLAASRPPWSLNTLAEAAALSSIEDEAHATKTRAFIRLEAAWLQAQLSALPGAVVRPTAANYLYVELEQASAFVAFAARRRLLVRDCSAWPGLPQSAVRVAVKHRWENEILVSAFQEFLCA